MLIQISSVRNMSVIATDSDNLPIAREVPSAGGWTHYIYPVSGYLNYPAPCTIPH